MDPSVDRSGAPVRRVLQRELDLVREAIALVAGGGSARVTVGGLRYGQELLDSARTLAAEAGVRLVPLWMPDDAGADIAVEAIDRG